MIQLNPSGILFNESEHRYFDANDNELQGITSTIIAWLFPDTYDGIPQSVLDSAKEHGSYVHSCIEMTSVVGATEGCPESRQFLEMLAEHKMSVVEHEYIVTGFGRFASPVDVVLQDEEGGIWLADIKTTSALHTPKVRLQLSIYALFFELLNPHLKVKGIVEIWLPKEKYRTASYNGWVEIPRTGAQETEETIMAYLNCSDPQPYLAYFMPEIEGLPQKYNCLMSEIASLEQQAKAIKELADNAKATLLEAFRQYGVKKIDNELMSITYIAPSKRKSVDSTKLKADFPEAFAVCLKETETKDSIKITLK